MKNKKLMYLLLVFLTTGFALVSSTLFINGETTIATNKKDFDIYFSGAELDTVDVSNKVIKDKKHIEFTSNDLKTKGDKSTLMYEVTNGSTQYDANVTISCTPMKTDYIEVTLNPVNFTVQAGKIAQGEIIAELIKVSDIERNVSIACDLDVKAIERTSTGDAVEPVYDFSLHGYFVNGNGEPVSNADLVIYSDTPHYVKTDIYGYFYVEDLERGLHEIYYLNTLEDPSTMSKEEIVSSNDAEVNVATNNKDDIIFDNKFEIVDDVIKVPNNKTYDITLNPNNGDEITTKEVTENGYYGALPQPTKTGYNFLGWYLDDDLILEDVYVKLDHSHTLKAKWDPKKFLITFKATSSSVESISKEVKYNAKIGTLPVPVRDGYTFNNWLLDDEVVDEDFVYNLLENSEFIADWAANKYTLSYDTSGGTAITQTKQITFGENYGDLPTPEKDGYTFTEWTLNDRTITKDSIVSNSHDVTLVAKWKLNTYKASLVADNSDISTEELSIDYNASGEATLKPNAGYYFNGYTCTNNYTIEGLKTGESNINTEQTITIKNNGNAKDSTCTIEVVAICPYALNTVWTKNYSGTPEEYSVLCNGLYEVTLYGAQGGKSYTGNGTGGTAAGALGSSVTTTMEISKDDKFFVVVGGAGGATVSGSYGTAGYNGGGSGPVFGSLLYTGGGGGATDIRTSKDDINTRILVAGGGPGAGGDVYASCWNDAYTMNGDDLMRTTANSNGTLLTGSNGQYIYNSKNGAGCKINLYSGGGGGGYYGGTAGDAGTSYGGTVTYGVQSGHGKAEFKLKEYR